MQLFPDKLIVPWRRVHLSASRRLIIAGRLPDQMTPSLGSEAHVERSSGNEDSLRNSSARILLVGKGYVTIDRGSNGVNGGSTTGRFSPEVQKMTKPV